MGETVDTGRHLGRCPALPDIPDYAALPSILMPEPSLVAFAGSVLGGARHYLAHGPAGGSGWGREVGLVSG